MKVALDSNVLVYAEGINGEQKRRLATDLIDRLSTDSVYVPVQAMGELYNVLVRKARVPAVEAAERLATVRALFPLIATTPEIMSSAINLSVDHRFGIWDAVIVAASASVGCSLLLSEDMHDGFAWGGVTIANPFADPPQPLLRNLLRS